MDKTDHADGQGEDTTMALPCILCRNSLTAAEAIALAEHAAETGQMQVAACYVNVAYAIYDASARIPLAIQPSPSPTPS